MGKKMGPLGMAAATGGINAGIDIFSNIIMGQHNDARQLKQQGKLNEQAYNQHRQTTEYNMQKQLEMWEKTGYKPTVEQMKKAGLNPAMMYGGSGAGGSTGIQTAGGAGGSAPNEAVSVNTTGAMAMGMEMALLKAQKENIEADTKQKIATAEKTSGVDTEVAKGQIGLLSIQTDNEAVKKEINEQIREQQFIETHIKTMSMNQVVAQAQYQTRQMWEVLQGEVMKNRITRETADEQIEIVKQTRINMVVQKRVMEMGIELTQEQMNKITADIAQGWTKLSQEEKTIRLNGIETQMRIFHSGGLGKVINMTPEDKASMIKQVDKIARIGKEDFKD